MPTKKLHRQPRERPLIRLDPTKGAIVRRRSGMPSRRASERGRGSPLGYAQTSKKSTCGLDFSKRRLWSALLRLIKTVHWWLYDTFIAGNFIPGNGPAMSKNEKSRRAISRFHLCSFALASVNVRFMIVLKWMEFKLVVLHSLHLSRHIKW